MPAGEPVMRFKYCLLAIFLAGCASPTALVFKDYKLVGEGNSVGNRFYFNVIHRYNTSLTCTGEYDFAAVETEFSFPVSCSDHRTGTVKAMRTTDSIRSDGQVVGEITLSDGMRGLFVMGRDANSVQTSSLLYQKIVNKKTPDKVLEQSDK